MFLQSQTGVSPSPPANNEGEKKMQKNKNIGRKVYLKNIPSQLKSLDNWIGWKFEKKDGKLKKPPYNLTTGRKADANDPDTWVDFETNKSKPAYGLGFAFKGTPFSGVDLDNCLDPGTGKLAPEVQKIVNQLDSYTEISPSGEGLHIIVEGKFTGEGDKTSEVEGFKELQMYHSKGYLTITGNLLDGQKPIIKARQKELQKLHDELLGEKEAEEEIDYEKRKGNDLSDDEVLKVAKESNDPLFPILWKGDREKYREIAKDKDWDASPSGADYQLCRKLAFYTGGDLQQMERLFNKSGLVREKWESRKDYRERTIRRALKGQKEFYSTSQRKPSSSREESEDKDELTQHQKLLEIAEQANLFKTPNNRMFAEITEDDKPYVLEIKQKGAAGGKFRHWMVRNYKRRYNDGPNSTAISRTMTVVRAECDVAEKHKVYKRIADLGDKILVDLAGSQRRAVEITPSGYKITEDPDVRFWRPTNTQELPEPEGKVENLKYLREFTNLTDQDFSLLVAWLLDTFQTVGPYPVLIPTGPAGAAKSTLTKLIRNLLDPAGESGRVIIEGVEDSDDLFSVAKQRHVIALDNISKLRRWQSDALSAIATGGGLEKRKLYTDDDLTTIDTMNPIVMNGIDISGIGDDLLDRGIFLHLEEPEKRIEEQTIWNKFEKYHGKILGGLCDALTTTLNRRNSIELTQDEISRMADFTRWVKASRPAIQKIEGLENIDPLGKYHENRTVAGREALLQSDLGTALVDFLNAQEEGERMVLWSGTTGELLAKLEGKATGNITENKSWPQSPAALGRRLSRMRTSLKKINIVFDKEHKEGGTINEFRREIPF